MVILEKAHIQVLQFLKVPEGTALSHAFIERNLHKRPTPALLGAVNKFKPSQPLPTPRNPSTEPSARTITVA